MPKTAIISARTDPELKRNTERVPKRIPDDVTVKALKEAKIRQGLESINTLDDLFEALERFANR